MRQEKPERGGPIEPLDLRRMIPLETDAVSDRLKWRG
jgi:hypothetical protein